MDNKKLSAEEILSRYLQKKTAIPSRMPGAKSPSTVFESTPTISNKGSNTVSAISSIKEMQKVMQDFAQKVTNYSMTKPQKVIDPKTKKVTMQQSISPNENRKNFNDFITENYLATSDIKGAEWSTDLSVVTKQDKQKTETDLIEMDIVVQTLKRIGGAKSEINNDNFWDFRTNNALKNIYAFAYALINLEKDFGRSTAKIFNENSLKQMHQLIPDEPTKLSSAEKINRSKKLIPLIINLGKFYEHYIQKIALNPSYRRYIDQDVPLFKVKPAEKDLAVKTPQEQNMMNNINNYFLYNVVLPFKGGRSSVVNVPLASLKSLDNLSVLIQNLGYTSNEALQPEIRKMVLDALNNNINYLNNAKDWTGSKNLQKSNINHEDTINQAKSNKQIA